MKTACRSTELMDESRAIQLCIRYRDPAGFEYLVKKYRHEAYGHALALSVNPDDAAEVCQESFASAFASLPKLDELTRSIRGSAEYSEIAVSIFSGINGR